MLLNGFTLDVLINNQILKEYSLPKNENSTTGPSYTLDEVTQQKNYSVVETYVAVKDLNYSVRFSSTNASIWAPLMAYVFVDGEYDYTYRELSNPSPRTKDSFWNNTLTKKYYFKFRLPPSSEMETLEFPLQRKQFGGLGAISIYFYKGKMIPEKPVFIPNFPINQVQVSESKSSKLGIKFTTAFEEGEGYFNQQAVATMEKQSEDPVAVLHLHYRPATWLYLRGCDIPVSELPNQLSPAVSEDVKPYSFEINEGGSQNTSARKSKYNIIRTSVVHSNKVIEIDDEENKISIKTEPEVIDLDNYKPKNTKRTYKKEVEVIELLDSDEEELPSKVIRID
ncbi:17630_t:CDS:2 [Funneliformis geosporum]|uniref:15621_t:CDS:1 n=1 Tax=Funneliformis geosporum TaxID=1117311 RepID=A0A9W4SAT5_9GLOM|nr:15621_t:CDS:2 [Funneliformis geosporum]CAI2161820.1 17630_t:CDS:2 [Funneliformis geosporum]